MWRPLERTKAREVSSKRTWLSFLVESPKLNQSRDYSRDCYKGKTMHGSFMQWNMNDYGDQSTNNDDVCDPTTKGTRSFCGKELQQTDHSDQSVNPNTMSSPQTTLWKHDTGPVEQLQGSHRSPPTTVTAVISFKPPNSALFIVEFYYKWGNPLRNP